MIYGTISTLQPDAMVQVFQLTEDDLNLDVNTETAAVVALPSEIQNLMDTFDEVFASKVTYPPPRDCMHYIPLILGARPTNIMPYRYAPTLKDEIVSQVKEMLETDLIQHSSSAFSSPVILVRKKDNT